MPPPLKDSPSTVDVLNVGAPAVRARLLRVLAAVVLGTATAVSSTPPATADPVRTGSAQQAQAEAEAARVAAASASAAVADVQAALARGEAALRSTVGVSVRAQLRASAEQDARTRARRVATQRVRAAYMDIGNTLLDPHDVTLLRTVASGGDVSAALRSQDLAIGAAARADRRRVTATDDAAARAKASAQEADAVALGSVAALREAAAETARLTDALSTAQAQVDALDARAGRLQAAEDAARALAQAGAAAAALATTATGAAAAVPASSVPVDYAALYAAGAATCPGMRTSLLEAVGQVESGHGRDVGPSSAGARGPMQFMPATFAAYAVDGDGDGVTDVLDPADAVHTAAAYLCANGGGRGRGGEADALWHYNHADWYVAMVQHIADQLEATSAPA